MPATRRAVMITLITPVVRAVAMQESHALVLTFSTVGVVNHNNNIGYKLS